MIKIIKKYKMIKINLFKKNNKKLNKYIKDKNKKNKKLEINAL